MNKEHIKHADLRNICASSLIYGHTPKIWNPKMASYVLQEKNGQHIFNIIKTSKMMKLAGHVLRKRAEKNSTFLIVGTEKVSSLVINELKKGLNTYYINHRWLGGMLTNWPTVQQRVKRLTRLENLDKLEGMGSLSKKVSSSNKKEKEKLNAIFKGIKGMTTLPDIVIFASQKRDSLAIQECIKLGIVTVAIVDTNSNIEQVSYPIPANDDSNSSINFILSFLLKEISEGSSNGVK